jgi:CheY-like chemotaxis protein
MPKSILLVDDEPQLLASLAEFMRRQGYAVTAAESGAQALNLLVASPPDLIISDIVMEEMDGFELQRRVNALTAASIPFLFLTAKTDVETRVAGLRGGADDYVTKPFDPRELAARVDAVLHRVEQAKRDERRESEALRARILNELAGQLRISTDGLLEKLNLVLDSRFGDDLVQRQAYLRGALADANTLRQLVADMSWATARASSEPAFRMQVARIAPLVRGAAAAASRASENKGVSLSISCGGLLTGHVDGPAMTRALAGLAAAAIEAAAPGDTVALSAWRAKDGGIEFSIAASGTGAADARVSAWEDDAQGPTSALALAQQIVEGHHGRLSSVSEGGDVRRIVIWIPGHVVHHGARRE